MTDTDTTDGEGQRHQGAELRDEAAESLPGSHFGYVFIGTFPTEENDLDEVDTTAIQFHVEGLSKTQKMAARLAMDTASQTFYDIMHPEEKLGGAAGDIASFLASVNGGDQLVSEGSDDGPSGVMFQ